MWRSAYVAMWQKESVVGLRKKVGTQLQNRSSHMLPLWSSFLACNPNVSVHHLWYRRPPHLFLLLLDVAASLHSNEINSGRFWRTAKPTRGTPCQFFEKMALLVYVYWLFRVWDGPRHSRNDLLSFNIS